MFATTRLVSLAGALALLGTLVASPAIAAPTFAFDGRASVQPGSSFQLTVGASDVTDLYAYQFDVQFDPSLFRATGVSAGGFLSGAGETFFSGGDIDNTAGTISFIFETLIGDMPGANGSGELVQISFEAIGPFGSRGDFTLANVVALDANLGSLDVAVTDGSVGIPEPSSLAMAVLALGALGAGAGRRLRGRPGARREAALAA